MRGVRVKEQYKRIAHYKICVKGWDNIPHPLLSLGDWGCPPGGLSNSKALPKV